MFRMNVRLLSVVKPTYKRKDWKKHEMEFMRYKKNISSP
jgi:hypothetical protein